MSQNDLLAPIIAGIELDLERIKEDVERNQDRLFGLRKRGDELRLRLTVLRSRTPVAPHDVARAIRGYEWRWQAAYRRSAHGSESVPGAGGLAGVGSERGAVSFQPVATGSGDARTEAEKNSDSAVAGGGRGGRETEG